MTDRLPADWFARPCIPVARALLGCTLVHRSPGGVTTGRIVETEAYLGPHDRASHSFNGRMTDRNRAMFGPKGCAYIYLIYGMHWCVNVVAGPPGRPQAVLVRALEPLEGLDLMRSRVGREDEPVHGLCRGPGKLCKAMGIGRQLYGADLRGETLFVLPAPLQRGERIARSLRIGIAYSGEYAEKPWRFFLSGNPCVSGPRTLNRASAG